MTPALAQPMEATVFEAEFDPTLKAGKPKLTVVKSPAPRVSQANTSLHGGVFKLFAAVNVAILGVFWMIFQGDKEALFMVAISGVYLASYFLTPFVMSRVARIDTPDGKSFSAFLNEPFETWTGAITGREALIQVMLIPTAILFAVIGMALVITPTAEVCGSTIPCVRRESSLGIIYCTQR